MGMADIEKTYLLLEYLSWIETTGVIVWVRAASTRVRSRTFKILKAFGAHKETGFYRGKKKESWTTARDQIELMWSLSPSKLEKQQVLVWGRAVKFPLAPSESIKINNTNLENQSPPSIFAREQKGNIFNIGKKLLQRSTIRCWSNLSKAFDQAGKID